MINLTSTGPQSINRGDEVRQLRHDQILENRGRQWTCNSSNGSWKRSARDILENDNAIYDQSFYRLYSIRNKVIQINNE